MSASIHGISDQELSRDSTTAFGPKTAHERPLTITSVNEIRSQKWAYTVEEAAELLSLSRAHVYRLLDLGELGSISIGRSRRITANQLQAFLTAREQRSVVRPPTLDEILSKRKR